MTEFGQESVISNRCSNIFSRGHATLHLAVSVGRSVRPSVGHISKLRAVFAVLLLPNRPRLDCRVSGLVLLNYLRQKSCIRAFFRGPSVFQSYGHALARTNHSTHMLDHFKAPFIGLIILPHILPALLFLLLNITTLFQYHFSNTGVAQGMTSLVSSVYVSEVSSSNARGFLGTVNQIATALGVLAAYVTTFGLNYEWMAVFGAANAAIVAAVMAFMPESPRW